MEYLWSSHTDSRLFDCLSCSRDESICSHVVANRSSLTTYYTSADGLLKTLAQFKGLSDHSVIRSYIGKPIYTDNQIVGTLCCFSSMDIHFKTEHDEILESFVSLIENILHLKSFE